MRIDGLDVVDNPDEVRARVGYLPDHPPLYDEMTVQEYLVFAARLRGLSLDDAESRVRRRRSGATQLGRRSRRCHLHALARLPPARRHRPGGRSPAALVVLDEPIAGLDPVQIVEMRELVRNLRHEHTTIISSHILSEISETCDRILVIRDGEIVASGTEAELSSRLARGRPPLSPCAATPSRPAPARVGSKACTGSNTIDPAEPGVGVATFLVDSTRDVREDICRALVHANLGVLEVATSERELESIFLRLAKPAPRREAA